MTTEPDPDSSPKRMWVSWLVLTGITAAFIVVSLRLPYIRWKLYFLPEDIYYPLKFMLETPLEHIDLILVVLLSIGGPYCLEIAFRHMEKIEQHRKSIRLFGVSHIGRIAITNLVILAITLLIHEVLWAWYYETLTYPHDGILNQLCELAIIVLTFPIGWLSFVIGQGFFFRPDVHSFYIREFPFMFVATIPFNAYLWGCLFTGLSRVVLRNRREMSNE